MQAFDSSRGVRGCVNRRGAAHGAGRLHDGLQVTTMRAVRRGEDAVSKSLIEELLAKGVEIPSPSSVVVEDLDVSRIEAGVVKINQISTGLALQAPFGGVKKSSTDSFKEQGPGAIEFYSKIKTVYLDYSA